MPTPSNWTWLERHTQLCWWTHLNNHNLKYPLAPPSNPIFPYSGSPLLTWGPFSVTSPQASKPPPRCSLSTDNLAFIPPWEHSSSQERNSTGKPIGSTHLPAPVPSPCFPPVTEWALCKGQLLPKPWIPGCHHLSLPLGHYNSSELPWLLHIRCSPLCWIFPIILQTCCSFFSLKITL